MIFGLRQVEEREADGEIRRVYHEIRQVLRINGVFECFRSWAGFGSFLPELWEELRPLLETRHFEDAADALRRESARQAGVIAHLSAAQEARLGEGELFRLRATLDLHQYALPKLLLVVTLARRALLAKPEEPLPGQPALLPVPPPPGIRRGIPSTMPPLELQEEKVADRELRRLFRELRRSQELKRLPDLYRALALWPAYLRGFWRQLEPLVGQERYGSAVGSLRALCEEGASGLPLHPAFPEARMERIGQDYEAVLAATEEREREFASLLLNVALAQGEWKSESQLGESPYPAPARAVS